MFSINDTPESSYYPCESVIAVGEVKSTLNTANLLDAFSKIESVKSLKRFGKEGTSFRKYCSHTVIWGSKEETFNQFNNPLDQIYGFIICEKIGLGIDTFLAKCAEEVNKRPPYLVPNMIVSLHDGVLVYINIEQRKTCTDPTYADFLYFVNKKGENFQQLLTALYSVITRGRTTDVFPFVKYIIDDSNYPGKGRVFKLR